MNRYGLYQQVHWNCFNKIPGNSRLIVIAEQRYLHDMFTYRGKCTLIDYQDSSATIPNNFELNTNI